MNLFDPGSGMETFRCGIREKHSDAEYIRLLILLIFWIFGIKCTNISSIYMMTTWFTYQAFAYLMRWKVSSKNCCCSLDNQSAVRAQPERHGGEPYPLPRGAPGPEIR
jgi:hypothetical protein